MAQAGREEGQGPVTVLHGVWCRPESLALWAELTPPADALEGADGPDDAAEAVRHPFAAGPDELPRLLLDLVGPEQAQRLGLADRFGRVSAGCADVEVRLPGTPAGPVPSDQVGQSPDASPRRRHVLQRPYVVPAVVLSAPETLALLDLIGPALDDAPVGVGVSLRWFVQVASFATDVVRRGRVLPTVQVPAGTPADAEGAEGAEGQALWSPVLTGPDAAWAQALTAAAPPIAAAACRDPRGRPARTVVMCAEAIDVLVDAAARAALRVWPFGYRKRARDREPLNAWLAALGSRQSRFDASADEIAELAAAVETWQQDAATGPVRVCFRLVEPGDERVVASRYLYQGENAEDNVWSLQFLLQPADEPSLLVEAAELWDSPGAARALSVHVPSPQDALLAELGRASRLFPALGRALREQHPAEMALNTEMAAEFLHDVAPQLAAAGFGVLLPAWWTETPRKVGWQVSVRPSQPGAVGTAGDALAGRAVEVRWQLALGEAPLSGAEMEELARAKAGLVRLRGLWVEVDPDQLAAALHHLKATSGAGQGGSPHDYQADIAELLQMAAGIRSAPGDLPVSSINAQGWPATLLGGESTVVEEAPPDAFAGSLRPYQVRGLAWMRFLDRLGVGGVLADDMGLGKTVQVLALLAADEVPRRTLLVCPMSIVGNWQREAHRFTPHLGVYVHHGADRVREGDLAAEIGDASLVITTYAVASRDEDMLRQVTWDRIIIDEAQTIKNSATRQSVVMRSMPAQRRLALTGTPVENRLADLWSLLDFANPGLLGSATDFAHRYAVPIEKYADPDVLQRLRRMTTPLVLRRVKTDRSVIHDLPAKIEMDVLCNLTREQASLYQATVDHMFARLREVRGSSRRGLILTTLTRLKQICDHPAIVTGDGARLAGRSGKLSRIEDILEEVLASHERALLFTQYSSFGAMLSAHLAMRFGCEAPLLHGGLRQQERDALVTRFQTAGRSSPPLLVASLKAGGVGLTLTAANHVVHVDRWWNPAVEDQATDRAYRIGQDRDVQVRKLVCVGTVEERIAEMIGHKRGLAGSAIGDGDQSLTDLSADALYDAFRLGGEAVSE